MRQFNIALLCGFAASPLGIARSSLSARMARWGLVIVTVYALVAIVTPLLLSSWLAARSQCRPRQCHLRPHRFSTGAAPIDLGRDVCVRTLQGSGVALQVVLLAVTFGLVIGVPLGMVSGYLGSAVDQVLVLLMDTLYTLPVLLLSVVLAFLLGRGIPNAAAALCVVYTHGTSVGATRPPGESGVVRRSGTHPRGWLVWILRRYLLLKILITSVPVLLTLNAADAVLVLEASVFSVMRLPETVPEWGIDLNLALAAVPTGIWWTPSIPAWRCSCWCWACRSLVRSGR